MYGTDVGPDGSCGRCGFRIHWTDDRCPECSTAVPFPNIRLVTTTEELAELDRRYDTAREAARARGAEDKLMEFESAVENTSRSVINVSPVLLVEFLEQKAQLSNYNLQVAGETRLAASPEDDLVRRITEAALFGVFAHHIRYAALSLDGVGLQSYGSCSVVLSDRKARGAASVLDENSYPFVERHGRSIPPGHRSDWQNRGKLAVAKLSERIDPGTTSDSFARILFWSEGDRKTDAFMEVHLYGRIDAQSAEMVVAPKPSEVPRRDREHLMAARDMVEDAKKVWVER